MKKKKTLKSELKELKELKRAEYKRYCKKRLYTIGFFYIWEECSKMYVYIAPLLIAYNVLSKTTALIITPIAILGSLSAFVGKMYHLKNTKFRKKGFYEGS